MGPFQIQTQWYHMRQIITELSLDAENHWEGKNGFPNLPNYMRLVKDTTGKATGNRKLTDASPRGIKVCGGSRACSYSSGD